MITADNLFSKFEVWEVTGEIAKIAAKANRKNNLFKKMGVANHASLLTCNKKYFKIIQGLKFI